VSASAGWCELPAGDVGDAIVSALAQGGVEVLFFTSGSEICFYQEAIAKARTQGRPAPRLITVTHEHANLNAALGYAAVSGKPAATAVHVDSGTLHHGGAVHTAMHAALPVVITAGFPPTTYAGTSPAARNAGGHLWLQETFDQHSIVRQYVKWDRRLNQHDNAGMIVSRALQVARSEPCRRKSRCSSCPQRDSRPRIISAFRARRRPILPPRARLPNESCVHARRESSFRVRAAIRTRSRRSSSYANCSRSRSCTRRRAATSASRWTMR